MPSSIHEKNAQTISDVTLGDGASAPGDPQLVCTVYTRCARCAHEVHSVHGVHIGGNR